MLRKFYTFGLESSKIKGNLRGQQCTVLAVAEHTETHEKMVVYTINQCKKLR